MPNLELVRKKDLSPFRRIAIGTWRTAKDPSVYGSLSLRMDEALRYIEAFREQTGRHLTVTHLMAKAVATVLSEMPDANAVLRFNRIYRRKTVDLFFQVAMEDERTGQIDLSGVALREVDQMSLMDVLDRFEARVNKVRAGKDEELEKTRRSFTMIPTFLLPLVVDVISLLAYELNLDMRWAGIPKDAFGSAMITNVGSLGLEAAYVPLVPYSHVPLLVAMGGVRREPVVEGDEVRIASVMRVFATFDHRILDGSHAARMARTLTRCFEDPWASFGQIPAATGAAPG